MNKNSSCESKVFFININEIFGLCKCNIIETICNAIYFIISIGLILYFSRLQKQEKRDPDDKDPIPCLVLYDFKFIFN